MQLGANKNAWKYVGQKLSCSEVGGDSLFAGKSDIYAHARSRKNNHWYNHDYDTDTPNWRTGWRPHQDADIAVWNWGLLLINKNIYQKIWLGNKIIFIYTKAKL